MTTKTVPFRTPTQLPKLDDWVGVQQALPEPKVAKPEGPTKRLTVDIPEDLHRRIKVHCAGQGTQISDIVRELLAKEFPAE